MSPISKSRSAGFRSKAARWQRWPSTTSKTALFILLAGMALLLSACGEDDGLGNHETLPFIDATAISATAAALPDPGIVGPPPPPGSADDDPFEGRVWGLTRIEDSQGSREALVGSEVNLLFIDGKLSGSVGCNTVAGSYDREGEILSFGALGVTRLLCARPEGIMEQERAVLDALEATTSFSLADGLDFRDASGLNLLHFIEAADRPRDPRMRPPSPPTH